MAGQSEEIADAMADYGILIHSSVKQPKLKKDLIASLMKIGNKIKIKGMLNDAFGYRVYFSDPSMVGTVLEKGFLTVQGYAQNFELCPLTTSLIVKNVVPHPSHDVKEDLHRVMKNKFGPILSLREIPMSQDYPEISSGNWLVILDVPEISAREIFMKNEFPCMTVKLPYFSASMHVKLFCLLCNEEGHTRTAHANGQTTLSVDNGPKAEADNFKQGNHANELNIKEEADNKNVDSSSLLHEKRKEDQSSEDSSSKRPLEPIQTFASRVGTEEVMRQAEFFSLNKETRALADVTIERKTSGKRSYKKSASEKGTVRPPAKKSLHSVVNHLTETRFYSLSKASSTTIDDEDNDKDKALPTGKLMITQVENKKETDDGVPHIDGVVQHIKTEKEDEPVISNIPSSSGSESRNAVRKPKRTTSITDVSSASEVGKTKSPRGGTATISAEIIQGPLIEECVRNAPGVLDRQKLQVFFVHAKKKTNLIQIATRYTDDVNKLRDQLKRILHNYYSSPETGSAEDIRFIKWLDGLEKRFDGPATKKRRPRNDSLLPKTI